MVCYYVAENFFLAFPIHSVTNSCNIEENALETCKASSEHIHIHLFQVPITEKIFLALKSIIILGD